MQFAHSFKKTKEVVEETYVTIELTAEELATLAAALGKTSTQDLRKSTHVQEEDILSSDGHYGLRGELLDVYKKLEKEGYYGTSRESGETY